MTFKGNSYYIYRKYKMQVIKLCTIFFFHVTETSFSTLLAWLYFKMHFSFPRSRAINYRTSARLIFCYALRCTMLQYPTALIPTRTWHTVVKGAQASLAAWRLCMHISYNLINTSTKPLLYRGIISFRRTRLY